MAADPTREETVTANLEAVVTKYGEDAYELIKIQLLKDIDISLAKQIDSAAK